MKRNIEKHSNSFGVDASIYILEKHNKRLFWLLTVCILALIITNGAWFYYESQFKIEEITTEVVQEVDSGEGGDAVIYDGVEIHNGESKADSKNHN
jgi:hypothetical protein